MLVHTQREIAAARQLGPDAIVKAMTDVVVDQWTLTGGVTEADLRAAGFTSAEIDKHGHTARDRAARLGLDPTDVAILGSPAGAMADLSRIASSFQTTARRIDADIKRLRALAESFAPRPQ